MSYHILFVIDRYMPYGGLQRDMLNIADRLTKLGHEVTVLTSDWQGDKPRALTIIQIKTCGFTNHGKLCSLEKKLAKHKKKLSYDCVVGFNKIAGIDVLYEANPCFAEKIKTTKSYLTRCLPRYRNYVKQERRVFQEGAGIELMLIAPDQKQHYINHYHTEPQRIHMLSPGIDRERLGRVASETCQQMKSQLGIPEHHKMVLLLGSGFRTKGVDRAIKAFATLPKKLLGETHLIIVGKGDKTHFEALAKKLDIEYRVRFMGPVSNVALYYHMAELLLHPARTENTGTVLLEAMYCGLPVLVSAVCGYANHVQDSGAGKLCPLPFNQKHLNQLLLTMLTDGQQEQRKHAAKMYCEKNDLYSLVRQAADVILKRASKQ